MGGELAAVGIGREVSEASCCQWTDASPLLACGEGFGRRPKRAERSDAKVRGIAEQGALPPPPRLFRRPPYHLSPASPGSLPSAALSPQAGRGKDRTMP